VLQAGPCMMSFCPASLPLSDVMFCLHQEQVTYIYICRLGVATILITYLFLPVKMGIAYNDNFYNPLLLLMPP
jgi:hypothetical protein